MHAQNRCACAEKRQAIGDATRANCSRQKRKAPGAVAPGAAKTGSLEWGRYRYWPPVLPVVEVPPFPAVKPLPPDAVVLPVPDEVVPPEPLVVPPL